MSRQQVPFIKFKPSELNDATWRALTEAWGNGLSDRETAFYVCKQNGATDMTAEDVRELKNKYPDVADLEVSLKSDLLAMSKMTIADAIRDNDLSTAKWYAERKGGDEFSTKQAVALEGAVATLSIEEKRQATKEYIEQMKNGEQ